MKELFFKMLNECFPVSRFGCPDNIFYVHDNQLLRRKKLNRILNRKEEIYINPYINNVLFEICLPKKYIWIDYTIWHKIEIDLNMSYVEVKKLISSWLSDSENMKLLLNISVRTNIVLLNPNFEILSIGDPVKPYIMSLDVANENSVSNVSVFKIDLSSKYITIRNVEPFSSQFVDLNRRFKYERILF